MNKEWTHIPGVLDPETFDLMGPDSHEQFAYGDENPFWLGGQWFGAIVELEKRDLVWYPGSQLRFQEAEGRVQLATRDGEPISEMNLSQGDRGSDEQILRRQKLMEQTVVVTSVEDAGSGRVHVSVFAAERIELVRRPWSGDDDYDEFTKSVVWPARAARWPIELQAFRSRLDKNDYATHDNYICAISRAHRLRDLHPNAIDDMIGLCFDFIELTRLNHTKAKRRVRKVNGSPEHFGYQRLILALESQGRLKEALEAYETGCAEGLYCKPSVLKRIERKLSASGR